MGVTVATVNTLSYLHFGPFGAISHAEKLQNLL